MYTMLQKIILGMMAMVLFAIGLLSAIKNKTNPDIFARPADFFLININTAGVEELKLLPYVSGNLADEIIRYRQAKKRINSADELLDIKGIGPARLKRMNKYLKF